MFALQDSVTDQLIWYVAWKDAENQLGRLQRGWKGRMQPGRDFKMASKAELQAANVTHGTIPNSGLVLLTVSGLFEVLKHKGRVIPGIKPPAVFENLEYDGPAATAVCITFALLCNVFWC